MRVTPLFTATISPTSDRAQVFRDVYGGLTVPLMGPAPVWATLPGLGVQLVVVVDVKALEADAFDRLVTYCAQTFHDPPEVVRAQLLADGMFPILAHQMTIHADPGALADVEACAAAGGGPC